MCPFDCIAFVVSGKVGIPLTSLTTPVGWLSTPTDRPKSVRYRFVISVFVTCLCCNVAFGFFSRCRGF